MALALGRTRSELLRGITSKEYAELLALARLERIGLERSDYHAATICQAMGAEVDPGIYQHQPRKTVEQEYDALAGVVIKATDNGSNRKS